MNVPHGIEQGQLGAKPHENGKKAAELEQHYAAYFGPAPESELFLGGAKRADRSAIKNTERLVGAEARPAALPRSQLRARTQQRLEP
jgi:hypothetical protein